MNPVQLLSVALVLAGLYITYQSFLIAKYKKYLTMATATLQAVYFDMMISEGARLADKEKEEEDVS